MGRRGKKKNAVQPKSCHHECEVFDGIQREAAESATKWMNCQKYPGHPQFIPVKDFINNHLPRVQTAEGREMLQACIDLTVGLRICYTSKDRPDDDDYSAIRGRPLSRYGTGLMWNLSIPKYNGFCPCAECDGKLKTKHWAFEVRTARHVVYNTEEAKRTKIDVFFDEDGWDRDRKMRSVWAIKVLEEKEPGDWCRIQCVTHDKDLGDRIDSALTGLYNTGKLTRRDLPALNLDTRLNLDLDPDSDREPVFIVSHPHGQSKKITVGEVRENDKHERYPLQKYTAPTCPGSSGAPVFMFVMMPGQNADFLFLSSVHSGSYDALEGEGGVPVNVGFDWSA